MKRILFLLAVGLSACSSGEKIQSDKRDTPVLYNAFSHNDYTRARPLEDALRLKYNCVEADIHLINDELYVRHDRPADTTGVPTLLDLYIRPLAERISDNWGKVYPDSDSPFFLMIDIKAQGDAAYDLLKTQLAPYRSLFCRIENGEWIEGPILLFFSGSRPMKTLPNEYSRFAFLDGKFDELGLEIPHTLMPVVSDNYKDYFQWDGVGEMPPAEYALMESLVRKSHSEKKKIRFWGGPHTMEYKTVQLKAGVDLIGEDNLQDLYELLTNQS